MPEKKHAGVSTPDFPLIGIAFPPEDMEEVVRIVSSLQLVSRAAFILFEIESDCSSFSGNPGMNLFHFSGKSQQISDGLFVPAEETLTFVPSGRYFSVHEGALAVGLPETTGNGRALDSFFSSLAEYGAERTAGLLFPAAAGSGGVQGLLQLQSAGGFAAAVGDSAGSLSLPEAISSGRDIDVPVALSRFFRKRSSDAGMLEQAEEAFRRSEELHAFEAVPYGTWVSGPDGVFTCLSIQFLEMLGLSEAEAAANGWTSRIPAEERGAFLAAWERCLADEDEWSYEYRICSRDGTVRDIFSKGKPVRDQDGTVCYWTGFHLDVTDRKRMERELRVLNETLEEKIAERTREAENRSKQLQILAVRLSQAEQSERKRLAQLIHDQLQQTLVAALMRTDLVLTGNIDQNYGEMLREVKDLLRQSLHTARSLTLDLSPPMLFHSGFMEGLTWLADRMEEKHGLKVAVNYSEGLELKSEEIVIFLFEAVRELLLNVVRHAETDEAEVSVNTDGRNLRIVIRDYGAGCRLENIIDRRRFSSGYGLWTIEERLQYLGGKLSCRSREGEGFRVELLLPLDNGILGSAKAAFSPRAAENLKHEFISLGKTGKIRTLLVDDQRLMLTGLRRILDSFSDIEVVGEALNGSEAIEKTRQLMPEVILMDVNMPVLNGIEATRLIRSEFPEIFIIGLSMNNDRETEETMKHAGANRYLCKEAPAEELYHTIRESREAGKFIV